jgi:thiamine biosynthesis lipoprotein
MGMPVTVEVVGAANLNPIESVFAYIADVDQLFSTYRQDSEIERINRGEVVWGDYSDDVREILELAEETRRQTDGYFDVRTPAGTLDPSGIVKGWAIRNAAALLVGSGAEHFFIEAGGDIQSRGMNPSGRPWSVGIRSPFNPHEIIKIVYPRGRGVATSGTYVRGQHIYNPRKPEDAIANIVSLTVIGPDILEADRFATAAFAMGRAGIAFIEAMPGLEGYLVHEDGHATMTSGFEECCTA